MQYIRNSLSQCNIINQYSSSSSITVNYGYNHFIFTPSQFDNIGTFYSGLIPAIQILNSKPFLYIDTSNHLYSDYYCDDNTISSGTCSSTFAKLNNAFWNNTMNWKVLIILSSNFLPYLSRVFDYNIIFNKVYTNSNLSNKFVNISINGSIYSTIGFYNLTSNLKLIFLI